MDAATIAASIERVQSIESEIGALRVAIDAEPLAVSDRQYLSRCFDLLHMELDALRQYLGGIAPTSL